MDFFFQCCGSRSVPYVSGPLGSGSAISCTDSDPPSTSKKRKINLDFFGLRIYFDFLSLKTDVNVRSKSNKHKVVEKKICFVDIFLSATDEESKIWIQTRILICKSVVLIHGSGSVPKCDGSTTLDFFFCKELDVHYQGVFF
jgi:hypothetical protein